MMQNFNNMKPYETLDKTIEKSVKKHVNMYKSKLFSVEGSS